MTESINLKLSAAQKKKALTSLSTLEKIFSQEEAMGLELDRMKAAVQQAEIMKTPEVSSDFEIPKLGKSFAFYAFSDGACRGNPGPGAWGSVVQDEQGLVIYEGSGVEVNTTNNRMELQGAIEALKFIQREFGTQGPVALVSDSKYVVDGLKSWMAGWKKRGWKKADKKTPENVEYCKEIDLVANSFEEISYFWVKGHSGHPQNEKCDELANEALDDSGF